LEARNIKSTVFGKVIFDTHKLAEWYYIRFFLGQIRVSRCLCRAGAAGVATPYCFLGFVFLSFGVWGEELGVSGFGLRIKVGGLKVGGLGVRVGA
jgi:hypothetical protein